VLGFNKAIKVVNTRGNLSAEYIVLTDGDIVVPQTVLSKNSGSSFVKITIEIGIFI
jgi:hypothetical protein